MLDFKKNIRTKIYFLGFVTPIILSLIQSQPVKAGIITDSWGSTENSVKYVFTDTLFDADLRLTGKLTKNENLGTLTLLTEDKFWLATLTLNLDETQDDELDLTVTLQHISKPHPDIDIGNGVIYSSSFKILAENYEDGFHSLPKDIIPKSHPPHKDIFSNEMFTFTKNTINFPLPDQDEIETWSYTLRGDHVATPESTSTLSLLALGTLGAASTFKRKLKRSKSTEKETTKVG
jgi:hypothetical protein